MLDKNNKILEEVIEAIELNDELIKKVNEKKAIRQESSPKREPLHVNVNRVDKAISELRSSSGRSWFVLAVIVLLFILMPFLFMNKAANKAADNKCCCVEVLDSARFLQHNAADTLQVCSCVQEQCLKTCNQESVLNTCMYVLLFIAVLVFILAALKILSKTIEKRADLHNDYYRALYDLKIRGIRDDSCSESSKNVCDCSNMMASIALLISLIALICVWVSCGVS